MSTHGIDIELPPLPEWSKMDNLAGLVPSEIRQCMAEYARAAIEADRKRIAELFMDLSRYAAGMYEQDYDPQMEGVSDGYWYAAEFLLGNKDAVKELEADRKRRGEPVAWLYEDELPDNYPYEVMFPYSKVDGVRMFPVYAPQHAEPVKEQSMRELIADDAYAATFQSVGQYRKALLARYTTTKEQP